MALRAAGHELVLTHGNGPQVGALMLQHGLGEREVAGAAARRADRDDAGPDRLPAADARSPRSIPTIPIATLLTRVVVDADDAGVRGADQAGRPVLRRPARRAGSRAERGWGVADGRRARLAPRRRRARGRGACSAPSTSSALLEPRRRRDRRRRRRDPGRVRDGGSRACRASIDKDRCSAELALAIGADLLVLLTGVPRVAVDFGTRWERELARLTVSDALRGLAEGEFPAGSMGPKIESAERFVEAGHGRARDHRPPGASPPRSTARTARGSSPTARAVGSRARCRHELGGAGRREPLRRQRAADAGRAGRAGAATACAAARC